MIHESVYDSVRDRLIKAYQQVRIGSPFDPETLCGPVHTKSSINLYKSTLERVKEEGGSILFGGKVLSREELGSDGNFVIPTICEIDSDAQVSKSEAFVPILYIMKFKVKNERGDFINLLVIGGGH